MMIYKRERRSYKNKIKEKKKAFKALVSGDQQSPWDVGFKILKGQKRGKKDIRKTMKKEDGTYTGNSEETNKYLTEKYFPEDLGNDYKLDRIWESGDVGNNDVPFKMEEVDRIIEKMGKRTSVERWIE